MSSCGGLRAPGGYDSMSNPLDSPGSRSRSADSSADLRYSPGSYVEVIDANAGLFLSFPGRVSQPDQKLELRTPLKVIEERGSYVRVETVEGQIGFIPSVMIRAHSASEGALVPGKVVPAGAPPARVVPAAQSLFPEPVGGDVPFVAPEPEVPPISVD